VSDTKRVISAETLYTVNLSVQVLNERCDSGSGVLEREWRRVDTGTPLIVTCSRDSTATTIRAADHGDLLIFIARPQCLCVCVLHGGVTSAGDLSRTHLDHQHRCSAVRTHSLAIGNYTGRRTDSSHSSSALRRSLLLSAAAAAAVDQ